MTDAEIIKVLKCCGERDRDSCSECPLFNRENMNECMNTNNEDLALTLIYRQQAEIKRATEEKENLIKTYGACNAEILTDFAEQVKQIICENSYPDFDKEGKPVNVFDAKKGYRAIDALLKKWGEGEWSIERNLL